MVGDLIIWVKTLINQCFCIHDYEIRRRECALQVFLEYKCKKCGRTKFEEL